MHAALCQRVWVCLKRNPQPAVEELLLGVAKPGMKETYCGRPVNEEDWLTTSRQANCTSCARAGAPTKPERPGRSS
jgi:hypothetical protein